MHLIKFFFLFDNKKLIEEGKHYEHLVTQKAARIFYIQFERGQMLSAGKLAFYGIYSI